MNMILDVRKYSAEDEERWDAFVGVSRNGTFFHTRRFLQYHPKDRFVDHSLLFMEGPNIVALYPAAEREEDGVHCLVSHPGASYGGLVLARDAGVLKTGAVLDALMAYSKTQGYKKISSLRLPPSSIRSNFSDDQEYWMFQRGWTLDRCEMDGTVDLRLIKKEELLSSFSGKCRNMVRQAERHSVTASVTEDFPAFWSLLEATLTVRHSAKPTHTLAEMQHLAKLSPSNVRLFGAFLQEKMIAGTVVITLNDGALYTLYMAQDYEKSDLHPMHCVLTHVMSVAIAEGRKVLHLGVSTEDGGRKVNEGLFFFKESFGCKPVRRESWSKIL